MNNLVFGIYPGGVTGTNSELELTKGKPDSPVLIKEALNKLQPAKGPLLVRCYLRYRGNGKSENHNPVDPIQYVNANRKLDLVLGYKPENANMDDWRSFVKNQVRKYGKHLSKIQITEEPNVHGIPVVDGDSANVREAVILGITAAKEEVINNNLAIQVGFNGVVNFDPDYDFWREFKRRSTPTFLKSLDYIGLDFFPDVFRPIPREKLSGAVKMVLNHFRNVNLKEAGISRDIPIHITENGWPTSPDRPEQRQVETLDIIIRTIHQNRINFNVTVYELFALRDADSEEADIFYQFGILRDDYSPKPAFDMYRNLIAGLG